MLVRRKMMAQRRVLDGAEFTEIKEGSTLRLNDTLYTALGTGLSGGNLGRPVSLINIGVQMSKPAVCGTIKPIFLE